MAGLSPRSWRSLRPPRLCGGSDHGFSLCDLCAFAAIALFVVLLLTGCTRTIRYEATRPDGTVEKFEYVNQGFDTTADGIVVEKRAGSVIVTVEKIDSQSRALKIAEAAIEAVKAGAK